LWKKLSDDDRFVLEEFYSRSDESQRDSIGNICDRFHIERSSAYKKKDRALAKLAVLLYGR